MFLTGVSLQHFRNYQNKTFLFTKPLTVFVAPNAFGKTNLLEAIHLLSTGESFRSGTVDDFIEVEQELARIKMKTLLNDHQTEKTHQANEESEQLEIELLLNPGLVSGKRVSKKIFSLNGVRKQKRGIVGLVPTIAFIPEDLRLITGSPSRRREFLDTVLTQIDQQYLTALSTYEQTLRRRNRLLQQIREGEAPRTTLSFWNLSLLKHGMYLQDKRRELIDHLNGIEFPLQFQIEYDLSLLSPARLEQYSNQEIAAGHTLVGPHKDDIIVQFSIVKNSHSVRSPLFTHGSRGQQRMGVLWLKLGSFEIIRKTLGKTPLLLLDDIFSELDKENRLRVLELAKTTQTIMTSAEEEVLQMPELKNADIIRL
ncbi:MAG: DNA replication and repair protein RecF [Patescibacteria group bacterium]